MWLFDREVRVEPDGSEHRHTKHLGADRQSRRHDLAEPQARRHRYRYRRPRGFTGITTVGWGLLVFIAIGPVLVLGYNLELFKGSLHTDIGFAAAWGSFPVLVSYYAQAERLGVAAVLAATAAFGLSLAQRSLSTPARVLRRRVTVVSGTATTNDGTVLALNERTLLAPLEHALAAMSWAIVALALALAYARRG